MYTNAHATILLVQRLKVVGVRLTTAQRAARDPRAKPLYSAVRLGTGQQLPGPADLVGRSSCQALHTSTVIPPGNSLYHSREPAITAAAAPAAPSPAAAASSPVAATSFPAAVASTPATALPTAVPSPAPSTPSCTPFTASTGSVAPLVITRCSRRAPARASTLCRSPASHVTWTRRSCKR
eukprot:scaffold48125_cov58-Phaeocystis_antarctica.AAC.3